MENDWFEKEKKKNMNMFAVFLGVILLVWILASVIVFMILDSAAKTVKENGGTAKMIGGFIKDIKDSSQ